MKAFLVLGAVVAATIGVIIATRPNPAPPAEPPTSTTVPTETEAIKIFNDLHELWLRSYRERDASLIKLFAAPDPSSPMRAIDKEIATLREDEVLDRTTIETTELSVLEANSERLRIRQAAIEEQRFIDESSGEDVGTVNDPQRLVIVWEIRSYDAGWRIYDSVIEQADPIET